MKAGIRSTVSCSPHTSRVFVSVCIHSKGARKEVLSDHTRDLHSEVVAKIFGPNLTKLLPNISRSIWTTSPNFFDLQGCVFSDSNDSKSLASLFLLREMSRDIVRRTLIYFIHKGWNNREENANA